MCDIFQKNKRRKSNMKKNNVARTANVVNQISQADELKKYKELLDNNVITQEEFDKKKNKY